MDLSRKAFVTPVVYFIFAFLWIKFSDMAVAAIWTDPEHVTLVQTYKGWAFVLVTSLMLYGLIKGQINALVKTSDALKKALGEKEILVREIHHRVKNNLQIINSMLNLQLAQAEDSACRDALRESQGRIRSLSMVHESLYKSSEYSEIDFEQYLRSLVDNLNGTFFPKGGGPHVEMDLSGAIMPLSKAIPCGLVINELMTNTMKYAFDEPDKGTITMVFQQKDNGFRLMYGDNGKGLPQKIEPQVEDSLGLTIVRLLVDQLEGSLVMENENGLRFIIDI